MGDCTVSMEVTLNSSVNFQDWSTNAFEEVARHGLDAPFNAGIAGNANPVAGLATEKARQKWRNLRAESDTWQTLVRIQAIELLQSPATLHIIVSPWASPIGMML